MYWESFELPIRLQKRIFQISTEHSIRLSDTVSGPRYFWLREE